MENKVFIIIYIACCYVFSGVSVIRMITVNMEFLNKYKGQIDFLKKIADPILEKNGIAIKISEAITIFKILLVINVLLSPVSIPLYKLISCISDLSMIINHKKMNKEINEMSELKERLEKDLIIKQQDAPKVDFDDFK